LDFIKLFPNSLKEVNDNNFEALSLDIFHYQAQNNLVYKKYIQWLGLDLKNIDAIHKIPFLPIEFYKYHVVKTENWKEEKIFYSSGTTGSEISSNYIKSTATYYWVSDYIFTQFYGNPESYHIFGLLPSYLEREGSSLVSMVENLIKSTGSEYSGFFLYDHENLIDALSKSGNSKRRKVLFGVSFALLDLANQYEFDFSDVIVIETGGMKGRGKELVRGELHNQLKKAFKLENIHSEYGMTELCSQAYAIEPGKYKGPPWMKILVREVNDPFFYCNLGETGVINIIDLANISTCCFIETRDLGVINNDLSFNILGRMDNSDLRGCSLMV